MLRPFYQSRIAVGTVCTFVIVVDGQRSDPDELFRQFWLELLLFEQRFSRFLPDSELSGFNRRAGSQQTISGEFRDVLLASQKLSWEYDGLYNPFILPALQRAGYLHSMVKAYAKDPVNDFSARKVVPASRLVVGNARASIPYGTAIDLGGCGKGYIADRLADLADSQKPIKGYWFSLGGDVIAGGSDEQGRPWRIEIEDSETENQFPASVEGSRHSRLAVATSSTRFRAGEGWHHIIDPTTGTSSQTDIVSATVCLPSAIEADVAATCLIILGSTKAAAFLKAHQIEDAFLQLDDGRRLKFGSRIKLNRQLAHV